jgi:hypothetical protein
MKRKAAAIISALLVIGTLAALIFVHVPTKQGVNYEVRSYSMPLYIKMIEFLDRDYQYRRIVREIVSGKTSDGEKAVAIFDWCVRNIKHQPKELAIIDDHPYSIIVRGYGVDDQLEDVFTILCTYAGYEAFYKMFRTPAGKDNFISFVKFGGKWHAFSAWGNAYPRDDGGHPVPVEDLRPQPTYLAPFLVSLPNFDPPSFLEEIGKMRFEATSMRVKGQSLPGRISYYLKKLVTR